MPRWRATLRTGFFVAALLGSCNAGAADALRIGGTGSAMEMISQLFAAFDHGEGIGLDVIPGLGTGGGLRAANEGILDIAVSGRPLTPEELARGLTQALEIRTPFGLVTSHPRPNGLRSADVAGLFMFQRASWADGSP